jgi:hypothetical protein
VESLYEETDKHYKLWNGTTASAGN